jgi:hypothetical protein
MLERCWEPMRLAIEPHLADLLLVALGNTAKTGEEEEARAAKARFAPPSGSSSATKRSSRNAVR